MLDISKERVFSLKEEKIDGKYSAYLIPGEEALYFFKGKRDAVAFTNKRVMCYDIQGITGSKTDVTSIPYTKINAFSTETAGMVDRDMEVGIVVSGMKPLTIRISASANTVAIGNFLAEKILV